MSEWPYNLLFFVSNFITLLNWPFSNKCFLNLLYSPSLKSTLSGTMRKALPLYDNWLITCLIIIILIFRDSKSSISFRYLFFILVLLMDGIWDITKLYFSCFYSYLSLLFINIFYNIIYILLFKPIPILIFHHNLFVNFYNYNWRLFKFN